MEQILKLSKLLGQIVASDPKQLRSYLKYCKQFGLDPYDYTSTMGHEYGLASLIVGEISRHEVVRAKGNLK